MMRPGRASFARPPLVAVLWGLRGSRMWGAALSSCYRN